MPKHPKRPRDPAQLAKLVVDIATGMRQDGIAAENPMSLLGRAGGLKGGAARAQSLSPDERRRIAKKAAETRWGSRDKREH
jgi:hypothetical protein